MEKYVDPVIQKYFTLIREGMGEGVFNGFYQGDPIRIPASKTPAIIGSKNQSMIGHLTNEEDEHQQSIFLTVVVDSRDTVSDDLEVVAGYDRLYELVEGRDAATYMLKTQSILNILRSNEILDAAKNLRTNMRDPLKVDYGITFGKREENTIMFEARIEVICTFSQLRSP